MEYVGYLALTLAALAIATAAVVVVRSGRAHDDVAARGVASSLEVLQRAMADLQAANATAVSELRGEMRAALGETGQQLAAQAGSTQRVLGDLSRQLGTLSEQSQQVGELAKDIGSLHDLLRAPKLRGGFGELLLERLLADALPADAFELQYGYRDGRRVDAVVRFAGRLVPIDAKFPMESFNAMAAASDDGERRTLRRAFLQQVKRHVDGVARYISPEDATVDIAFMYVPAERIYYELAVRQDEEADLREHCAERNVIPVSPNTLVAYLQLVALGLRGLAIEDRARELHAGVRRAALEAEKFRLLHDQLGRHLENATKKFSESERALDRATAAIDALAQPEGPVLPRQEALPLRDAEELRPAAAAGVSADEGSRLEDLRDRR
ncbi:MAG: DNA recombination protein RmuC [Solirubrobacteraceae bacterium]